MKLTIRPSGWRRVVALLGVGAVAGAGLATAPTASAQTAVACDVAFSANPWNDGNGGFTASITITNVGDPINGWTLAFDLPGSAQLTHGWSATWNQQGQTVTAQDLGWNANLGTGGQTTIGFNGSGYTGNDPTEFTLNGTVCDGEPGGGGPGDDPAIVAGPSSLNVPEGGVSALNIQLSEQPAGSVVVSLSTSGDPDISVSPTSLTLDAANWNTGQTVTVSAAEDDDTSNGTATITASATGHASASISVTELDNDEDPGGGGPGDRVDNPYVGADVYVNPDWSAAAQAGGAPPSIYNQPTAVWLDRIAAIDSGSAGSNTMGLADHLDEAVAQDAANGDRPLVFQMVVYNLPGRDCAALASNGELGPNDLPIYESQYIDVIADILDNPEYADLRIAAVIEIDSLPNLVTNTGGQPGATALCDQMLQNGGYVDGVGYALGTLGDIPNVYNYVDAAHHGWIGWDSNFAPTADIIWEAANANGATPDDVHGFITNTANYSALREPFIDMNGTINGQLIRSSNWIDWNQYNDELTFAQAFRQELDNQGFDSGIGMLIDTSRNGWGGPNRPDGPSSSTDLNTFVDESRIDRRIHKGNWCNQAGAGLGERPQPAPEAGIDAYVWIKPPGESDGSSEEIPNDEGKGFDRMCDPTFEGNARNGNSMSGALPNAPLSGHWFQAQFDELLANAWPAVE
jgi:cellulose 1,4-beta-cellobiosidase